jgi:hypothetical protein
MNEKFSKIFNFVLLTLLIVFIIYFIIANSNKEQPIQAPSCVESGLGSSLSYDSCYDAYSKTIFLNIKRGYDNFKINSITISFFDFSEKKYEILSPAPGKEQSLKIQSEKNPKNIEINLDINDDTICKTPKNFFVNYCPERMAGSDINATMSPLKNATSKTFTELGSFGYIKTDKLALTLADKERIWGGKCDSEWTCSDWEGCSAGLQKRTCHDGKNCFIPTNVPQTSKLCGQDCKENWECEWSKCTNGVSTPSCTDLNNCGTKYNIPKEIKCSSRSSTCIPNIVCTNWTQCLVNYDFFYLNGLDVKNIGGIKNRICVDKNSCAPLNIEEKNCSLGVDIYTKIFTKCGVKFVGLYNKLDDKLIAKIDRGTPDQPHMDIVLDGENDFCDYCLDGIIDGDEEKIDCGGSCKPC